MILDRLLDPARLPRQRNASTLDIVVFDERGQRLGCCPVRPGEEPPACLERTEYDDAGQPWETTYLLGRDQNGQLRYTWAEALG